MVHERQEMLEKSATLYFGPWYRQSPFFNATRRAGCTAYDIYNHMYLPAYYDDPETEYWALANAVTMWDVGVERTIEVSGPDADRLIDMITCRDLTKCAVKQGKYMLVTAPDGSIANDPVLLHVGENRWWMQLADSDAGLYALGVAATSGLDVEVTTPDVHPMQVQGPMAAKTLEKLVGPAIYDIKYYWIDEFDIEDGRAQGTAMRYSFYGRFDANGTGHIVGRIRQRDGSDGLPFELAAELRDNRIVGTGRYEFVGPMPGAKDGPVNRQGTCSAEMQRVI